MKKFMYSILELILSPIIIFGLIVAVGESCANTPIETEKEQIRPLPFIEKTKEIQKEKIKPFKPLPPFEHEILGRIVVGPAQEITLVIIEGHKYIIAAIPSYRGGIAIIHAHSCPCLNGN